MSSKPQSSIGISEVPSPRDMALLDKMSDRKKSHELNSMRNKSYTAEERINKLGTYSKTRKLE